MFYLIEVYLRLKYCFFSLSLLIVILLSQNKNLFVVFFYSLLLYNNQENKTTLFSQLTYTEPSELFNMNSILIVVFLGLFFLPYLIWQLVDFFKPSFYILEYNFIKHLLISGFILIHILYYFIFLIVIPHFWYFYISFNNFTSLNNPLKLFFELTVQNYFHFMINLLYYSNIILFMITISFFFLYFFGLKNSLFWKKLLFFFNFIFATFLSTSDIVSQLIIFLLLTIILEFYYFTLILWLKLLKNLN